jgi:predicted ATP-grasp superfamily ATP-dependent carboligase
LQHLKILLSEGSSTSARQTLYGLAPLKHAIDVCDPQRLALCRFSRYVRRWHRGPSFAADPAGYLRFVLDLLRVGRYDVLFPVHDQVYLFSRFRDALRGRVGLAVPDFDAVRQVQSKVAFYGLLKRLDIPQPQTVIVPSIEELQRGGSWPYPCWVKRDVATAARGVWHVRAAEDLPSVVAKMRALSAQIDQPPRDGGIVVQQPAVGEFCVAQAVFQHGRLIAIHCYRARAIGAGGSAYARESASHPQAIEHLRRLGAHLRWHGALHAEYFHDPANGSVSFIEANPRIGETVNALFSGVNLCDALLRVSLDETVESWPASKPGVRTHALVTSLLGIAERGQGRGALLAEIYRAWRRRGVYHGSEDELTRPRDDYLSAVPAVAVALELLADPRRASRLIQGAVNHYALSLHTARAIDELPADFL